MGIIARQSVKGAFWSYLGIVIGYLNVGIIMPQFFDTAQVGLVQLFASVSLIFAQFGTLGFTGVINRLFPFFRDQQTRHNGFLFLLLVTGFLGFSLCLAGFIVLKPWIIESNLERSPLLVDYLWLLMPLVLMRILFLLLDNYNKMLYDAVTGTFWMEFAHRVINLVLILLVALKWINFPQFFTGYVLSMSLPVVPVILVLMRRGNFSLKPHLDYPDHKLRSDIRSVMVFGFLNGLASVVLMNIDRIFVNQYLSLNDVGIFGVCALFASLIRVPFTSISKIATGIIAEAWKIDDRHHIREIYRKAALNQAIAGTLAFTGLLVNLDNIFKILPPDYSSGKWVLVIYSAGMLINTVIGLAGNITETSKYYRFNTLFLLLCILIQFGLSYLLIPPFGITGAALATVITIVLNSTFQSLLQKLAFGITGITGKIPLVILSGILSYAVGRMLPVLPLVYDILLRSLLTASIFLILVVVLKASPDMNAFLRVKIKDLMSVFNPGNQ